MTSKAYEGKYLDTGEEKSANDPPSRSPSPRRKSGESSPTRSEYGGEVLDQLTTTPKFVLHAFNTKSGWNVRIKNPEGVCLYYADNSAFTPKKPDVTLHTGSEKTGPTVGVVKWSSMYSKDILVGLGDPGTNEANVIWEDMKSAKNKAFSRHFEYSWKLESADGSPAKTFAWVRAGDEKDPDANKFSSNNIKLVDQETGQTVVIFGSNRYKSWKKLGKFTMLADYGERWMILVLLTGLGLIEMSRRRSRARRSSGGGGGGGGGGG